MLCQPLIDIRFSKMDCIDTLNDFTENEFMDYLSYTPNNVISHVFNYLTKPSDLYHAMVTCRRWKELALDPPLWKEARKAQWNVLEGINEPSSSGPLRSLFDKLVGDRPEPLPPIGGHSSIFYKGKVYYLAGAGDRLFSKKIYCFDTETMKWASKMPLVSGADAPLTYHHSSNLIGNTVYVWGGVNFSDTVFTLNLDTMSWDHHHPAGDLPSTRHHHCAVAVDKKIWVMGGQTSNHSELIGYDHVSILDTETMTWDKIGLRGTKAGIPTPMRGSSAVLMGRKIFVFGGLDDKRSKADLWELNIDTLTWSLIDLPSVPKERYAHACTVISNEEFLCYGGYDGQHDLDTLTVFNIKTGRWWDPISWGEKSPHYRTATTITWIGDRAIVFGGLFYVDTKIQSFNDVHSLILRGPKLTGH